jgi:hypothetical protein
MNGMRGKKSVDIMSPTAMEASSINSMAILIRVRKKIKRRSMMRRTMADKIKKMSLLERQ